jgi:hypothetical protein
MRLEGDGGQPEMTLTEIGSWVGLATGIFTVFDRFFVGRPIVSITKGGYGSRYLECANISDRDIIITGVRASTKQIVISQTDSVRAISEALVQSPFSAILKKRDHAYFPIVVVDGAILDKDSRAFRPFVIAVSWRKMRSMWLPQFPALIFSSVRALRRLEQAKTVGEPL